jgi:hypothetical protein
MKQKADCASHYFLSCLEQVFGASAARFSKNAELKKLVKRYGLEAREKGALSSG